MGETGKNTEQEKKIQRSNTFEVKTTEILTEKEPIVDNQIKQPEEKEKKSDAKKEIKRSKSLVASPKVLELIKNAEMMPHHVPEKKAKANSNKTREEVSKELEDLHATLEAEENRVFGKEGIEEIKRTRYATLNDSKRNKRIDSAMNRLANAAKIAEAEAKMGELNWQHYPIDKERFAKEIRGFMIITDKPFLMDKDDRFAHNLQKNYELCETAYRMKKWVNDAVEGGYFPSSISLSKVEEKISSLLEFKEYLDVQKELMKNPYYQYMAKGDISYTDNQIKELEKQTTNEKLKEYLTNVARLRKLTFVRKNGMSSVKNKAVTEGKRQTTILREREAKKQLLNTFEEEALNIRGSKRFRDKNYDSKFTQEAFEQALEEFRKLDVKAIHFNSLRNIADHFKENSRLFDQNREFEHMLFIAVNRNLAPADEELIKLRAKINTIKSVEYMMYGIQRRLLVNTEDFLNKKTEAEFLEGCQDDTKKSVKLSGTDDMPLPGMDLDLYQKNILQVLKREHKNRANDIRKAYALMHPVKYDDETIGPGVISEEELERRKADFEKNSFINDYVKDIELYAMSCYGVRTTCFAKVYSKRKGIDQEARVINDRVLSQYILGMSSKELQEVIDIEAFGTEKEKEAFWKKIFDEAKAQSITELDTRDMNVFVNNMPYKSRMVGIFENLTSDTGIFKRRIKDKEIIKEAQAIYDAGCANAQLYPMMSQVLKDKWFNAVPLKDWFSMNVSLINEFADSMSSADEGHDIKYPLVIDGVTLAKNRKELETVTDTMSKISTLLLSQKSNVNSKRAAGGYLNTASISLYEARKKAGISKDTTKEEFEQLRAFYTKNKDIGEVPQDIPRTIPIQDQIVTIENTFKKLMDIDLSLFSYKSFKDIVSLAGEKQDRFKQCIEATRLAQKILEYIDLYNTLRTVDMLEGDVKVRLNDEHVKEIKARADVLKQAGAFFSEPFIRILESPALEKTGMSLDEILHLTETEISENLDAVKKGDADTENLWNDVREVIRQLAGFDLGLDLRIFIPQRRFENGCLGESREKEITNIFNGKKRVLENIAWGRLVIKCESEQVMRSHFAKAFDEKNLSITERENKMNNPSSRLCKKKENAILLNVEREKAVDQRISARRQISGNVRRSVGEEAFVLLSAFMIGNKNADEGLLTQYANKDTRYALLDKLTKIMALGEYDLDVTSDAQFAQKAKNMEELSARTRAFDALLKLNPEYLDELRTTKGPDHKSDYDSLMEKLNDYRTISDYYRARSLMMTDAYYINHYNEELSENHDEKTTQDQRRIADLIRLTALCGGRIGKSKLLSRYDEGIEDVLTNLEKESRQRPYLFGQIDFKKADISYATSADREIRRYFKEVVKSKNRLFEDGLDDLNEDILQNDDKHPFPAVKKYETEAVKQYIAMLRYHSKAGQRRNASPDSLYNEKQIRMKNALNTILKIGKFELVNPKTNETIALATVPDRVVTNIVQNFGADLPVEEVLEIADGFTVIEREKLDVNNEADFAYAKMRWLDSAKKLFYLEYNSIKRFESTYGQLPDQLPTGSFMHGLGASKVSFYSRTVFGQEISEMTEEKTCDLGGKKVSLGEYLVHNGLIQEDEFLNCRDINYGLYNTTGGIIVSYMDNVGIHSDDEDRIFLSHYNYSAQQTDARKKNIVKGPSISHGEERKVWREALDKGNSALYGGDGVTAFKKQHLDLYSNSERRALKEKRKNEAELIKLYNEKVSERENELIGVVKEKLGDKVDENLLKSLIVFHPAMLTGSDKSSIPEKDTDEFISLVKDFAGIDVPEGEKTAKKQASYQKMVDRMSAVIGWSFHVDVPENLRNHTPLIDEKTYEDRNAKINYESVLMRTTVVERISNSMQSLLKAEEDKSVISEKTYNQFRNNQKDHLYNSILKALKTSSQYLLLKDIGNREDSVSACELAEVYRILIDVSMKDKVDLEGGTLTEYRRDLLKKFFGIEILKTSEIFGLEEENNEKQEEIKETEKKVENKEQDKEEFEIDTTSSKNEIKEEDEIDTSSNKNEIKEEKKKEKKEKSSVFEKNRINIIQDQQDPLPTLPDYKISLKLGVKDYEQQEMRNCWACAGALLYNSFMGVRLGQRGSINQFDVRGFDPSSKDLKSFKEIAPLYPTLMKADYDMNLKEMRKYMGKNKKEVGSIYEVADFFIKKNRNMVIRRMEFALPTLKFNGKKKQKFEKTAEQKKADIILYEKQKKAFLDQVNTILSTGQPVAFYNRSTKHFLTITGINGKNLTVLDSSGLKQEPRHISTLLNRLDEGNVIEITWFSKLRTPKDETDEQPMLQYSEENGYGPKEYTPENAMNPTWKEGFSLTRDYDDLKMKKSVYIPFKKGKGFKDFVAGAGNQIPVVNAVDKKEDNKEENKIEIINEKNEEENKSEKIEEKKEENKIEIIKEKNEEENKIEIIKEKKEGKLDEDDEINTDSNKESDKEFVKESDIESEIESDQEKKEDSISSVSEDVEINEDVEEANLEEREKAIDLRRRKAWGQMINIRKEPFAKAVDAFMKEKDEGHSDEFREVKRTLDAMHVATVETSKDKEPESLIIQLSQGRFTWTPENYAKLTELFESLTTYLATHASSGNKDVQSRVRSANYLLDKIATVMNAKRGDKFEAIKEQEELTKDEQEAVIENVEHMAKAYRAYSARVGEDLIASADEKLTRRWDMLKSAEADILYFERTKRGSKLSDDERYLLSQYKSIKEYIGLKDSLKKDAAFSKALKNKRSKYIKKQTFEQVGYEEDKGNVKLSEAGLTRKQLAGVREIDHWILRNFKNGGYMSLGLNTVDRSDIAARLMSKSPRERLYIYYIVQHPTARKSPKMADAISAQMDYEPDVGKFKNQILASRFKFYTRFSGGYVYWHKLTQAMAICESNRNMLEIIDNFNQKEELRKAGKLSEKDEKAKQDKAGKKDELEQIDDKLNQLILELYSLKSTIKSAADPKKSTVDKEKIKKTVESTKARLKNELNELMALQTSITDRIKDIDSKAQGTGAETEENTVKVYGTELATIGSMNFILKNAAAAVDSLSFQNVMASVYPGTFALSSLGSMFSMFFTAKELLFDRKKMTDYDKAIKLTGFSLTTANIVRSCAFYAKSVGDNTAAVNGLIGTSTSGLLTFFDIVYRITDIAYTSEKKDTRASGIKLAKKAKKRDSSGEKKSGEELQKERYRDGLIRLDKILAKKENSSMGFNAAGGTLSATSTAVFWTAATLGTALTGGIAAGIAALSFTLSSIAKVRSSRLERRMRQEVVASFFDVEDMMRKAEADWKREHGGLNMSRKQKSQLREQILYRLSASIGYYSPSQLSHELALGYGQYLLNGAQLGGETAEMCINIIKGLGVPFKMDPETKEIRKPTASDIAHKLC